MAFLSEEVSRGRFVINFVSPIVFARYVKVVTHCFVSVVVASIGPFLTGDSTADRNSSVYAVVAAGTTGGFMLVGTFGRISVRENFHMEKQYKVLGL
jgi:hypothetical protein